jgi:hypothetical protein
MRVRTMLILAVIAALLLVIALVSNHTRRSAERLEAGPIFPGLTVEAVGDIFFATQSDTAHLVRQAGRWHVATEGAYPADSVAVTRILDTLGLFDRRHLHSTNPDKQAMFEVDPASGTEVRLSDASGAVLAHFRVGKNGPDFRSQFIRPEESNEVFRIPSYLRSAFDATRATWRDKTIFAFDKDKVRSVRLRPAEGDLLQIIKQADESFAFLPDSSAVNKSVIESTIRTLATLRSDAFPDSLPSLADAGLDPPLQEVEVQLDDGAIHKLAIGALDPEEMRHYVKRANGDTLFLLSKGRVTGLLPDREKLSDRPPPPAPVPEEE